MIIDWEEKYHSERALRLDYENEIRFLRSELDKLTRHITNLELLNYEKDDLIKTLKDQIPKVRKIKFYVCSSLAEFDNYLKVGCIKNTDTVEHRIVRDACSLKGISNPNVVFIGNWMQHPDIINIVTQIKIATRP